VTDVSWSRAGDGDCIRLDHLPAAATVAVRVGDATTNLPAMAGVVVKDQDGACFVPRFAFVAGTTYTVEVDGATAAVLVRARPDLPRTTEVLEIRPSAVVVPRNLLRLYVRFSAPMGEGDAATQLRLLDGDGQELDGALLPSEHELWDPARTRLTVLLDPARIKRGLVSHREIGYPLSAGGSFRVVVGDGFRDARGARLRVGAERRYEVGDDERRHVEPDRWTLTTPRGGSVDPLVVAFDRPLDHGLLARCLAVAGPGDQPVAGMAEPGPEERSWRFVPSRPWATGAYELAVDPVLEDLAGNSVGRVFDRDLERPEDDPRTDGPVRLPFSPG
jgi:hypothetical protein